MKTTLRKTKNESTEQPAILFCLEHGKEYGKRFGRSIMTVGILVPGKAYWEECWSKTDGLLETTLENPPDNVFCDTCDVTNYDGFWKLLKEGRVIVAASPYYFNIGKIKENLPEEAIAMASHLAKEEFNDGWLSNTQWHDHWHPLDKTLISLKSIHP